MQDYANSSDLTGIHNPKADDIYSNWNSSEQKGMNFTNPDSTELNYANLDFPNTNQGGLNYANLDFRKTLVPADT